jgi:hypothetical protein
MESQDLASDLLDGVTAIAQFTGWRERRVYYLAERGLLPQVAGQEIHPAPTHCKFGI